MHTQIKCKNKSYLGKLVEVLSINLGSLRLKVADTQAKIHIFRYTHKEKNICKSRVLFARKQNTIT